MEAIESHPEAGFAASKMLFYDNSEIIDRVGDAYTRARTGLLRGQGESASKYDKQEWIFGACAGAALKGLKGTLKKRRQIQRNKRVNDDYIWGLLEKELFFPRLKRRLQKD